MLIVMYIVSAIFIIRFHFEIAKVSPYLKEVKILKMITDPIILPIRKLLPKNAGFISTILPLLVAFALIILLFVFLGVGVKKASVLGLAYFIISWFKVIQYGIFIYVILSWIQIPSVRDYYILLDKLFQPILKPIRDIIPNMGGLDLSPLVLIFGMQFLVLPLVGKLMSLIDLI